MNDNEKYLIGRPPRAMDVMVNENGQSVVAVVDPRDGTLRWRDTQSQQWAKAPKLLCEEDPLKLKGYGPASLGIARRRRSGSATRRAGEHDGLSDVTDVSSVAAASSRGDRSWEELRTETSFGTFEDDKSMLAAGEDSPPTPPTPQIPSPGTVQSAGGDGDGSPSFADPDFAAPVPDAVQSLLVLHATNAQIVGTIRTLLECEVGESMILKQVAKLVATAKAQVPGDEGPPKLPEEAKSKMNFE